ncbi:hypothetical protein GC425_09350 [Corynebacterium sp. zg254]|uniref:Cholesterol esterase n=1 Tax=Corynebacterium zhongnanshanii TaxID=2768834 RepID=A0ABQ6VBS4_9CORY|nr:MULTISPECIES: DUF6230 family protein [Corynebacterium]KAB3519194.1 hypothetical protein F8377_09380 [Corynebacterium zhongnanshanii]MCR5915046.1 hypothetical protein [Corynebacterium sp. zg254]
MGHIKKTRFAAILGVGLLATAGTGVAVAQGGLSAHLALSNQIFNLQVSQMDGDNISLFTDSDKMHNGTEAITRLRISKVKVKDVCMAAPMDVPGMGHKTFQMQVPGQNFEAKNLVIGAKDLQGGLKLEGAQIGIDTHQVDSNAAPGTWGIAANKIQAISQKIKVTSMAADELTAAGGKIKIVNDEDAQC